jgi:predicted HicB family RNase H-like nuclease
MKKLQVELPEEMIREMKIEAAKQGISLKTFVKNLWETNKKERK